MIARFAFDGPVVVLPAREATILHQRLRVDELRRRVRGADPAVDDVLLSWSAIAAQHVELLRGGSVEPAVESLTRGASAEAEARLRAGRKSSDDRRMTSSEAAVVTGLTARAIRMAATEGRLRGELVEGRWRFDPDDVAAYAA